MHPLLNCTANTYCMMVPLSVLTSSVDSRGLVCFVSLIVIYLVLDHPTGGLLTVGDGIISMVGLELGSSTLSSSSSQSQFCIPNCCLPSFGPSYRGSIDCRRWDHFYGGVRIGVIYIKKFIFPVRRETPTVCFSALAAILTIHA